MLKIYKYIEIEKKQISHQQIKLKRKKSYIL